MVAATATGRAFSQENAKELSLFAVRVRGVPAERIAALMYQAEAPIPSLLPSTVAGKSVLQVSSDDPNVVRYLYVNGEAFYGIIATGLPTADVAVDLASAALDALP